MLVPGYSKSLIAVAEKEVEGISLETALKFLNDNAVQFVDVRDVRELDKTGGIPKAFHAPRGMLEFWIDPESPYHKPVFANDKLFIFYCALDWRATLAAYTAQQMGIERVSHLEGGFKAWSENGLPTEARNG